MRKIITAWIRDALIRRRSRKLLAQMDARMLKDIGLSRSQAQDEAAKPFWKP